MSNVTEVSNAKARPESFDTFPMRGQGVIISQAEYQNKIPQNVGQSAETPPFVQAIANMFDPARFSHCELQQ